VRVLGKLIGKCIYITGDLYRWICLSATGQRRIHLSWLEPDVGIYDLLGGVSTGRGGSVVSIRRNSRQRTRGIRSNCERYAGELMDITRISGAGL
jgi:hypothetical protein